ALASRAHRTPLFLEENDSSDVVRRQVFVEPELLLGHHTYCGKRDKTGMVYNPNCQNRATRGGSMSTPASGLANIGKSVTIRGDISGSEDIYVDGHVEGSIQLNGNSLTIGPNGHIKANINARNVTVSGSVEGNIQVTERTEMR